MRDINVDDLDRRLRILPFLRDALDACEAIMAEQEHLELRQLRMLCEGMIHLEALRDSLYKEEGDWRQS